MGTANRDRRIQASASPPSHRHEAPAVGTPAVGTPADAWLPLNDMTDGREWPVVWLSLALSLVIYVSLAIALARFIPGPDSPAGQLAAAEAAAEFLPDPQMAKNIRPEPLEKARYLLGLLCIPTLPTAFYLLGRRFMSRRWLDVLNGPGVLAARDLLFLAALLAWFITILRSSALPNTEGYLLVSFLLALVIVFRWRGLPRMSPVMSWCVIGAIAILGFLTQLVGENWLFRCPNLWHHLDILLAVVNQVAHGKTVLVDTTSQYGLLYPSVIAAALAPFGVSMTGMTVVFAMVVLLQSVLVFLAVARLPGMTPSWKAAFAVTYAGLAAPMLSSALFNAFDSLFYVNIRAEGDFVPVYFQFVPIRTIWFAFFVWFCSSDSRTARPWFVPLGYILAGASFLWNADTGLVILLAWTGMLIYTRLDSWSRDPVGLLRHAAIHAGALAATVAGSIAFYAAFTWLRCGEFPRFNELFFFQKIFYQAGFYMWPMPLWEFWQPIVALFVFTIAWCLRQAVRERIPAPAPWLFFIAAYGLGTFSYYQGRSMLQNLPTTFLPAALLSFFWARQGLAALSGLSLAEIRSSADLRLIAIKTLPVTVFCLCGFLNLCRSLPASVLYATDKAGAINARDMEPIWAAIRPHVEGKAVAILADPAAFMHTKTGSWSALPVASLIEVFLKSQLAEVQRSLEDPETVVVMQPELMPRWCQQLDLTAFKTLHQLPNGFVILQYDPAAAAGKPPGLPAPRAWRRRARPGTRRGRPDRRRCRAWARRPRQPRRRRRPVPQVPGRPV